MVHNVERAEIPFFGKSLLDRLPLHPVVSFLCQTRSFMMHYPIETKNLRGAIEERSRERRIGRTKDS